MIISLSGANAIDQNEMTNLPQQKIALLMDHPSPHMVGLLDAIAQCDGVEAEVLYFRPGAPERSWGDPPGKLPFRIAASSKSSSALLNVPAVLRMIAQIRADIWVVNTCYTAPETWAAIRLLNQLDLQWVYMNEPARMRGLSDAIKRSLLRLMLKRADGIIGMGRHAEAQYSELTDGKLPSISVPYYLNLSEFFSLSVPEAPGLQQPIRFFTAGQMIHRKAFDVLLTACSELPDRGWSITIAGDGPLRSKLQRTFSARWGHEQIRFLGHIPYHERANVFAGHHVFVFPSRWDGWGMAPVEAMAAGLPVISSDQVMSMQEFIREDENGYLIPSENATELAERMKRMMANPDRIPAMGRAARSALAGYSPEVGAKTLTDFLERLMEHSNGSSVRSTNSVSREQESLNTWRTLTEPERISQRLRMHTRSQAKRTVINISLALRRNFRPRGNRILVYHLVLREDRALFDQHLAFLKDHYKIVTARELAKLRGQEQAVPLAAITFDDGFRVLMSDALELLEKHNVKATFYVPSGFVDLASDPARAAEFSLRAHYYQHALAPMTADDLRDLQRLGHEIGSHGVSHVSLNAVSRHEAAYELENSRRQLAHWLHKTVTGFAYPYGDSQSKLGLLSECVAAAGYEYAVTLQRGAVTADSDSMQLQREHAEGNWRVKDLAYFLGR